MSGNLAIKIMTAKLKRDTETFGKMDPYVILKLGGQKWKSKAHDGGGKTPSWSESTSFRRTNEDILEVEVWDKDSGSKDDLVGQGVFPISKVAHGGSTVDWVQLNYKGKVAGEILLDITFNKDGGNQTNVNSNQFVGMSFQQAQQFPQQQMPMQQFAQQPMYQPQPQFGQQPFGGGFQQVPQQQQFVQQQFPQQQFGQPQQFPQQQFGQQYPQQQPQFQQFPQQQQQFQQFPQQQQPFGQPQQYPQQQFQQGYPQQQFPKQF